MTETAALRTHPISLPEQWGLHGLRGSAAATLRVPAGLTQSDLGGRALFSQEYVSQIERAARPARTAQTIEWVCGAARRRPWLPRERVRLDDLGRLEASPRALRR